MGFVTEWYDSREHKEEGMPIVEGLIAEVREACAVEAEGCGYTAVQEYIREGRKNNATHVALVALAGLDAIRKYFEDYEEVEVDALDEGRPVVDRRYYGSKRIIRGRLVHILVPKPAHEMLTVSRETLAVLAEHYEATPDKDTAGDAALTEAKEAL